MRDQTTKRIGLCRHFSIPDASSWKLMTAKCFNEWIRFNEKVHPEEGHPSSPLTGWDVCFTSDLPRAKETALVLASSIPVHIHSTLREVPFAPFHLPLILPKGTWLLLSRLHWLMGNKILENRKETFNRAEKAIELLEKASENNTLVVTHGFFMHVLIKKLRSLGYEGRIPLYPEYGKVYVFEKKY